MLLILLLGLVCYSTSFTVPFMFDDFDVIVFNRDISGGRSLLDILLHGGARRIADFSFAINYRLHAQQVAGYHLTNLAIHLAAAFTFYLLCTTLADILLSTYGTDRQEQAPTRRFMPLAAALLFVCHPIQTQAVTYIVQRHTSLATLFYLLSLLAFLKGRALYERTGLTRAVFYRGGLFFIAALLACYTKQIAFSLPLMIMLMEFMLFRGRLVKQYLLAALFVVILLFVAAFLPVVHGGTISDVVFDLRHAITETIYFPRTTYLFTQFRVIATYLRLLVLPVQQNLDYDFPLYSSLGNGAVIASLSLHVMLLASAAVLFRKAGRQPPARGHQFRLISLGICWFYVALLIESSFIPITDVIMEHRLYLPSAGFFIAAIAVIELAGQMLKCRQLHAWIFLAGVCGLLATATVMRNRLWSDEVAFWEDAARKSPRKGRVVGNLANVYLNSGRNDDSLRMNVAAIMLDPGLERAWRRLGVLLKHVPSVQGRFRTGQEYLTPEGHIDFRWFSKYNSVEYNNMALACEYLNFPQEASKWYWQSVQMDPDFDLAWLNLGLFAAKTGNATTVARALARLQSLNPVLARQLSQR